MENIKTKLCKYCKEEFPKRGSHWILLKDSTTRCKKQIILEMLRPSGPIKAVKKSTKSYI